MAKKLSGKTAIITGASAGIGWSSAIALAEEGANLVVTGRRKHRLDELAKLALAAGAGGVTTVPGNAQEEAIAKDCVAAALKFGAIDILINNVGMGIYKDLVDTSVEDYHTMVNTNILTTFLFTRFAVPHMIERGSGTILMISSMAGVYGFAGEAVYCATKFSQVGFAQALDRELRPKGNQGRHPLPRRRQDRVRHRHRPHRTGRQGQQHARGRRRRSGRPPRLHPVPRLPHHRDSDAHHGRIPRLAKPVT